MLNSIHQALAEINLAIKMIVMLQSYYILYNIFLGFYKKSSECDSKIRYFIERPSRAEAILDLTQFFIELISDTSMH